MTAGGRQMLLVLKADTTAQQENAYIPLCNKVSLGLFKGLASEYRLSLGLCSTAFVYRKLTLFYYSFNVITHNKSNHLMNI